MDKETQETIRQLILAHVPEAEYLNPLDALLLATRRDNRAADAFLASYYACQS